MTDATKQEFLNESMKLLDEFRSERVKARQAAMQGLADALRITLEVVDRAGIEARDAFGQRTFEIAIAEARAALEAARPFLERK